MIRFGATISAAVALAVLAPAAALAQQPATISGQVTDEGGNPLPAVQVFIQQLTLGTQTGADGRYIISVPATRATGAATLTARRIGFQQDTATVTLTPGATITHNFALQAAATQLASVTVTALGLDRSGSELGTSVSRLSTEELNRTESQSVVNQIQGKVAGVQITGSGTQGGSQNIVIRGASSLTGSNQPLFVVDGIPVSNTGRGGDPDGGYDFGSAINDLNPDDIETMTILKGPNAAAIYGSRAANGAVIITTKRARTGAIRTELSATYTFDQPSIMPEFQNLYGQGVGGAFQFVDGAGGGQSGSDGLDQSWGPRLDGRTTGCQWVDPEAPMDQLTYDTSAPCSQFTAPGQPTPWVAHPDNVESFFQTGGTLSSTLAVSGGTDRVSARLSIGRDNVEGYIPNNTFTKTSALLSGQVHVNDKLNASGSLNYIRNVGVNRAGTGYNTGILEQFIWFGRQVDMNALQNYAQGSEANTDSPGREYNWIYIYHNNPFWLQRENPEQDTRDRFIGSLTTTYDFTDWLSATARAGGDVYTYDIDQNFAAGNINYTDPSYSGGFRFRNDYSRTNSFDLFVQADRELIPGLTFQGLIGGSQLYRRFNTRYMATDGISTPGIYNVSNAAITPDLDQNLDRRRVNSVLGSAAFTWQNWLTMEVTGRNDWSSTLPDGNNSYFYPSLSTSVVLTEAIPALRGNSLLSLARIRGSIAQVGNDASPYSLATTYIGNSSQFGGLPQFSLSNTIANADLKPEITKASEVGLELGFLDGRASLDATYYFKSTRDQIFNIDVSPTTGFSSRAINAGRMDNRGIEALVTLIPVRLDNSFEWTTSFNYAWNKNKVVSLVEGLDALDLGSSWYTYIQARVGESYGAIYGNAFVRDDAGNLLIDNGLPLVDQVPRVIGNISPKWTGGWSNTFTYRNFSLNALLDMRIGGDIVSITNFFADYAGVSKASLRGREVDWNNPGIVVDGIDQATGEQNTTNVTAEQYFQGIFPVMEPYVYDGSWVKLRELRFGMDLPQEWANRMSAERVTLALIGRNLWAKTHVPSIDPEFSYSIGNYQGVEFAALPNTRSFGFSVNIVP